MFSAFMTLFFCSIRKETSFFVLKKQLQMFMIVVYGIQIQPKREKIAGWDERSQFHIFSFDFEQELFLMCNGES